MKKLLIVLLSLCASAYAAPQYTTVTATLMDSSAQVWANASWTTEFSKPAGNNGTFTNGGTPVLANQNGVANASGVFTVTLDSNLAVSPSGSGWKFTICPNATVASCNTIVLTIFGASQNVSTQLNAALTVPVVNTTQIIARAYNDTEVNASYGALYINSITNTLKQCIQLACNGSGWANFGVSSNNPIFTGILTTPCVKFNFDLVNDSTLCSQPGTGHINLLLPSTGGTLALAGAGTSPGSPVNSVQFNLGGAFTGDSNFLWDNTSKHLSMGTGGISISGAGVLPPFGDGSNSPSTVSTSTDASYNMMLHVQTRPAGEFGYFWQKNSGQLEMGASDSTNYQLIQFDVVNHQINVAANGSGNKISLNSPVVIPSLSTSTSPVCPNGTGGALTTTGCVAGGGNPLDSSSTRFISWLPSAANISAPQWAVTNDVIGSADSGATFSFNTPTSTSNASGTITNNRMYYGAQVIYGGRNFTYKANAFIGGTTIVNAFNVFIGLSDDTLMWNGTPPSGNTVGFFYHSNGSPSGVWSCLTNVGPSGGGTNTQVATAASTTVRHAFEIDYTPTSVVYKIDGTTACTITTNIPSTATMSIMLTNNRAGASGNAVTTEYMNVSQAQF